MLHKNHMNLKMNLQDKQNMLFHYGLDGVQLVELHGKMFTHYLIMMQQQELIMLDQVIEC